MINCEVLYSTVHNVAEETHSILIVVAVVVSLDLPGVLVEVGDLMTVTVKGSLKGIYGAVRAGVVSVIVITNGMEKKVCICILCIAKVNI